MLKFIVLYVQFYVSELSGNLPILTQDTDFAHLFMTLKSAPRSGVINSTPYGFLS